MHQFTKTILMTAFATLAIPGFAATTSDNATVSPAEKAKIQAIVKDYLTTNPEVIMEALQTLQKRQYEQAEQTVKQTQSTVGKFGNALFHQTNDPVVGNANGKITIVEFFDYQCPHCVDMLPVLSAIIKANPDVRVIYKEWPIRGPMSLVAARAALAAGKQGKYEVMHTGLLTANQPITQDLVITIAKKNGLDVEKLKADMSDASINSQLETNNKLARDLKLFGTPAFFIGKTDAKGDITYIPGQMNQTQLQEVIDKANK